MTEVLPLLYLHGLSSGDFAPALEQFMGTAAGLSASAITRLDQPVAGRGAALHRAGPVRRRLRVAVGALTKLRSGILHAGWHPMVR